MSRASILIAAVALAACGGRDQPGPSPGESAVEEDVIVRGELTYRQKIALPPDARALVELRGSTPGGSVLVDRLTDLEGSQVPVPFELSAERGAIAGEAPRTFRGAIYSQGLPIWVSDPVSVDTSNALVELGTVELRRFDQEVSTSEWQCGDETVIISFAGEEVARLAIGEEVFALRRIPSASGGRYEAIGDASTFIWNKGDGMILSAYGERYECTGARAASAFRARGNEPGWLLEIGPQEMKLVAQYGEVTTTVPTPQAQSTGESTVYAAKTETGPLTATIAPGPCMSMSGMPHPKNVTVEFAGNTMTGCGGEPSELLVGDAWVVDEIGGEAVAQHAQVTLKFMDDGRVGGSAGCNSYSAGYELTGETLSFSKAAKTMKACAPELMQLEDRFLDALVRVNRFAIGEGGTLRLETTDGGVIKAHRA